MKKLSIMQIMYVKLTSQVDVSQTFRLNALLICRLLSYSQVSHNLYSRLHSLVVEIHAVMLISLNIFVNLMQKFVTTIDIAKLGFCENLITNQNIIIYAIVKSCVTSLGYWSAAVFIDHRLDRIIRLWWDWLQDKGVFKSAQWNWWERMKKSANFNILLISDSLLTSLLAFRLFRYEETTSLR